MARAVADIDKLEELTLVMSRSTIKDGGGGAGVHSDLDASGDVDVDGHGDGESHTLLKLNYDKLPPTRNAQKSPPHTNGDAKVDIQDDSSIPEMNDSHHSEEPELDAQNHSEDDDDEEFSNVEIADSPESPSPPPGTPSPVPSPPPSPVAPVAVSATTPVVWSWSTTFGQRQLNLLRFGFFSDFAILLGPDKQKVLVHKAVLAASSIVMYNSILKVLSEGVNVLELDDDPMIFTLFLQYIYTGDSGVTFKEAFSLQKLAKKYQVPDLVKQCEAVIAREEFSVDSAFVLLPLAFTSSHETLLAALLNFVCKNGSAFVKDKRFSTLPENVVLEILKRDDLAVRHEMEVLSAVVLWGQEQCKLKKLGDCKDPANFGPLINSFLRHIRFPCDFAPKFWLPHLENVGTKNTNQILRDLFNPRHHFIPYNKTVRRFSEPMCLVHSRYSGKEAIAPLVPWRCKNPRVRLKETLMFLVNFPFTFFGFSIVRGAFGENFDKNLYDYSELIVQTTIITHLSVSPIVEVNLEPGPKPELRVHFQQPVDIPAHKWVTLVISFAGNLKFKSKMSSGDFQKMLISNCELKVGVRMTSDHNTTLIPMEVKMILPIMCEFRRASATGDQLPIDKGYIESLQFSLNRPHPQGRDTSRQQTNHLPSLCSFEQLIA